MIAIDEHEHKAPREADELQNRRLLYPSRQLSEQEIIMYSRDEDDEIDVEHLQDDAAEAAWAERIERDDSIERCCACGLLVDIDDEEYRDMGTDGVMCRKCDQFYTTCASCGEWIERENDEFREVATDVFMCKDCFLEYDKAEGINNLYSFRWNDKEEKMSQDPKTKETDNG